MAIKRYCLVLAVVAGILQVPAPGEVELLESDRSGVIAQPEPALAGINAIFIAIDAPGAEPNGPAWVRRDLDGKLIELLQESGMTVNPSMGGGLRDSAILRVTLHWLNIQTSQQCVFSVRTSLERTVILPGQPKLYFGADVWKSKPVMQAVSEQDIRAKATEVVLEQAEAFLQVYAAANPPGKQPSESNASGADSAVAAGQNAKPQAESTAVEYSYVASKNSQVFHKPGCRWAKNIKPANLVGYNSKDEATKAGKRPCKLCKP
jgi:hypothetical protein